MDTEKQKASPGGTAPAPQAPPILTPEDVEAMEAMTDGASGYFYQMLDYIEERVREGVRQGRFTVEQAHGDLDTALWYAYACNNIGEYEYYYRAAQWMADSEAAAREQRSGIWFYRYGCALMYCGRLEEARRYAEEGVALDPDYVWGWLEVGKLRSHFGDREGALEAVRRGLELEPGDYEFLTLRREIQEGRTLEEMEFHWIDPDCDQALQDGEDESEEEKRQSIACICCDRENLEAIQAALSPTEWEADAPYCTFTLPYQGRTLTGRFFLNEAAVSKLPLLWVQELVRRLPELERRGRTFLSAQAGVSTEGLAFQWFAVQPDRGLRLSFQQDNTQQLVYFRPDFSLQEADSQPALQRPTGGSFLAFVLLEMPGWDEEKFRRDLLEDWGIPCLTEVQSGENGGSTLVFEVDGMLAAVSLYPFPVPRGEAEENAAHNYLWSEAEETTARHQAQLLAAVSAREQDPRDAGALEIKLVRTLCRQAGVLGIYANGTVYQPEFYEEAAAAMEEEDLPLLNLVWLGLYRREGGLCGYTDGLRSFGKDEIEVLDTPAEPGELRSFLFDLTSYVVTEDATFHDGETLGFDADQRLPITRSAGVWHDGMTVKIGYPQKP